MLWVSSAVTFFRFLCENRNHRLELKQGAEIGEIIFLTHVFNSNYSSGFSSAMTSIFASGDPISFPNPDRPRKVLTLAFIRDLERGELLLGLKKRGFGEGNWNGFGGKVELGETIEEGAIRYG